jgi:hypothetical protein
MNGTKPIEGIRVMVSSTAIDLPDHRKQVHDACLCEGVFPIGMESLPARDADAMKVSFEMVDSADIYIGIYAFRYGHIPEGKDISITEMEYRRAVDRKIPILVFLMSDDHLITSKDVEATKKAQRKLKNFKQLVSKNRNRSKFNSATELRAQVIHALADWKQRYLLARSPVECIKAEKLRLQQLDPTAQLQIFANDREMHLKMEFPNLKFDFLNAAGDEKLRAFFEKGEPFQIKAKDIPADVSPILSSFLKGNGEANILVQPNNTVLGCLQFQFFTHQGEPRFFQADGKWALAAKRCSFSGSLAESPFEIELVQEAIASEKNSQFAFRIRFNWPNWVGQALQGLAYFSELNEWVHKGESECRSFMKGNQFWPKLKIAHDFAEKTEVKEAFEWLERCRKAASYLQVNPPFPQPGTINSNIAQAKDVALMLRLIEDGVYEQSIAGESIEISFDNPFKGPAIGEKELKFTRTESFRIVNFLGVEISFGPINHTWEGMELTSVLPCDQNRSQMTLVGGPNAKWKMEYQRSVTS